MAQGRMVRGLGGFAAAAALAAGMALSAGAAADPAAWVAKVNDIYRGRDRMLPDDQRSEKILLPAVGAMEAPPADLATPLRAALIAPGDALWSQADAWAQGAAQRAAIEALRKVGESEKTMAFLLLYGADQVPAEWKSAGMYVDLGTPPLLAAAQFHYLRGLDHLAALTHVEATRLGEAGQPAEALQLLADLVQFGRQMADREFTAESAWGLSTMAHGLERIRDVAWTYRDGLTDTQIKEVIDRAEAAQIRLDRLVLPQADHLAAEQIVEQAYIDRQGPNPDVFGATMARLSAKDRPLALFGESARWQALAPTQAGTFDTIDAVADVFGGWQYRWNLPAFDRALESPSDYDRLEKSKFAMVEAVMGPTDALFAERQALRAELAATRAGLAALAFERRNKTFPSELALTRPTYIKELERDPWSKDGNTFEFFVPIRDQPRGERELPKPHVIGVALLAAPSDPLDPALIADAQKLLSGTLTDRVNTLKTAWKLDRSGVNAEGMNRLGEIIGDDTLTMGTAKDADLRDRVMEGIRKRAVNIDAMYERATNEALSALSARVAKAKTAREVQEVYQSVTPDSLLTDLLKRGDALILEALQRDVGTFPVELDDSVFVIYSAGTDQVAEWARSVGEGGTDILYWPPLLSLVREDLKASGVDPTTLTAEWIDFEPLMGEPVERVYVETKGSRNSGNDGPSNNPRRRID